MNYFQAFNILGLTSRASPQQVKAAYRKAAMRLHPDRAGGDAEAFKKVAAAYEFLKNPPAPELDQHQQAPQQAPQQARSRDRAAQDNGGARGRQEIDASVITEEIAVTITLRQAFDGCTVSVRSSDGQDHLVDIIPGTVHRSLAAVLKVKNGIAGVFVFIDSGTVSVDWGLGTGQRQGTVVQTISVPLTRMILGGWHIFENFDGAKAQIYITPGCAAGTLVKIKDGGYWRAPGSHERSHATCRLTPIIKPLDKWTLAELESLKQAIEARTSSSVNS